MSSDTVERSRVRFRSSEMYRSRHLLYGLVVRDFRGGFRYSLLGYFRHVAVPVMAIFVFVVAFSPVFDDSIPDYWAYVAVGVFAFDFLFQGVVSGMHSITGNRGLVVCMESPREIPVFASTISALLTTSVSFVILILLMLFAEVDIDPVMLLFVPLILVIEAVMVVGAAFFLSSLAVYLRWIPIAVERILPLFMFLAPILYAYDVDESLLQAVVDLDPLTYYVVPLHDAICSGLAPEPWMLLVGFLFGLLALMIGFFGFKFLEKGFAERLR